MDQKSREFLERVIPGYKSKGPEISEDGHKIVHKSSTSLDPVVPPAYKAKEFTVGFIFQPTALWIGAHYSDVNKRLCVNLIPCCTVYFVWAGGNMPRK